MKGEKTLKSILSDLDNNQITKHQAFDLIATLYKNELEDRLPVSQCEEWCHDRCDCSEYCNYGNSLEN